MEELKEYYESQLKRVSSQNEFERSVQITSDSTKTNWLGLNNESATVLVKWLKENYIVDEG